MYRQRCWLEDDLKNRKYTEKFEYTMYLVNGLRRNQYVAGSVRSKGQQLLTKCGLFFPKSRQRNRCRISGRSHFVTRRLAVSRFVLKL